MATYCDNKNKEGYEDSTVAEVLRKEQTRQRAFYVFKTMISVARLGGFYVNNALIIEDSHGDKYNSDRILKSSRNKKHDV